MDPRQTTPPDGGLPPRIVVEEDPQTILMEAQALVYGPRQASYDHPLDNFTRIAAGITVILERKLKPGEQVSPEDVGLIMAWTKIVREAHSHQRDNLVDIAGYAETVSRVITERGKRAAWR